jgi:hypothetical protein
MTGSLAGVDGASAAWGNWADASVGYGDHLAGQVEASMGRMAALLREGRSATAKEAVDHSTYVLAERARLMALTLRRHAAAVKVEAAGGLVEAADALETTTFWRYTDDS